MKPRLLLHICCAACATRELVRLARDYAVTGCFANPDIASEEEFLRRAIRLERLAAEWHVPFEVVPRDHARFLVWTSGLEGGQRNGQRCTACYRLRLAVAAERAVAYGCTHFATTLTDRPGPPSVAELGREAGHANGLVFVGRETESAGPDGQCSCACEFSISDCD